MRHVPVPDVRGEQTDREGSQFHDTYGYYAQGVDSSTATLPKGWESRLVRLQTQATDGRVAYCLDVVDLFMSKCAAARPKDREFNLVLLRAGLVDTSQALQLIHDMPIQTGARQRMAAFIQRLASQAKLAGPLAD